MRYALNKNNDKIEPEYSGQRALCPGCRKEVTGKIYQHRNNHWAHLKSDCDKWYEPISDWHIKWQNLFPKENQEIILFDKKNSEFHRADIRLDNGLVIEIQNSPIAIKEVSQRENFYNKNGLIWVLNAKNLIPKSRYGCYLKYKEFNVTLSFDMNDYPTFIAEDIFEKFREKSISKFSNIKRTDFTEIDKKFENSLIESGCSKETIEKIRKKRVLTTKIIFYYSDQMIFDAKDDYEIIKNRLNDVVYKLSRKNYNQYNIQVKIEPNIKAGIEYKKYFARTQWKRFIDEMNSPVFLDNVTDLHSDYLYWVQKEIIVKKKKFIEKYLSYTKAQ